ncbi:MAG TPA: DUF4838 domain-containing protein [Phycisphaerae bacterium]|nr:DUF4838 domain-containing protein [Phycisphaerae bacterium]HRY71071.1 DUF4838 domain-containing protein [Phycisphaerae bacterium]HSA29161.1 DUF4838 domain-containing protein [Phycisphaerae bacterium]
MNTALPGLAILLAGLGIAPTTAAVTIAEDDEAKMQVVIAPDASPAERTASEELCAYLSKATGAGFHAVPESDAGARGPQIHVGPTGFARRNGLLASELGPEEWVIRTVENNLIIIGGRPRGTLYGAYHFLEDVLGVHWWNPFEETVPHTPTLTLERLNRRGQPTLRYRDIYMLYGNDHGRFAARNRLNRQGDEDIGKEYGGARGYGPPYHVHTFYMYVPPETHFKEHPEWFSLINGKRTAAEGQLCLTNPDLRAFVARKLAAWVQESHEAAAKEGLPPPTVLSISQNDWNGACQCDACQAIAKQEESEAGPLLDFVNHLADSINDSYPAVYLDTLAYFYTDKPPRTIKPRDNVIIRLCDTGSNFTRPITDPENTAFREHVLRWSQIAKNLRIWEYAVTYGPYPGFPMPTVHTYPLNFQFYSEHNVEGVFTELEYPVLADMRDFKMWMMMKLLEDPHRDYGELVRVFTDGFYGPAGGHVREYLSRLEAAANAKPCHLGMGGTPRAAQYLDLVFVQDAMSILDRAQAAVRDDPMLVRRVRHARLPLDRATLVLFPRLAQAWMAAGGTGDRFPLNRDAIAQRCRATWFEQIEFRLPESQRAAERKAANDEVAALTVRPAFVPFPERFRGFPAGTVFDFTADASRNHMDIAKVVPDAAAESGITTRLELREGDPETNIGRYRLPMPWGLYDPTKKKGVGSASVKAEDVAGPGYQWYKMGTFTVTPSCYVYFFWSWIIQIDVDNAVDAANPDRPFEIWARIKFEGPGFPHGKPEDKNAISVERVILVKPGSR